MFSAGSAGTRGPQMYVIGHEYSDRECVLVHAGLFLLPVGTGREIFVRGKTGQTAVGALNDVLQTEFELRVIAEWLRIALDHTCTQDCDSGSTRPACD